MVTMTSESGSSVTSRVEDGVVIARRAALALDSSD